MEKHTIQDVYLFEDTIYNNIRFSRPDATEMEILDAAEKARVLDFALELREGVNTPIGEGGYKLSHGEKLCIRIARALLKDKTVIVID